MADEQKFNKRLYFVASIYCTPKIIPFFKATNKIFVFFDDFDLLKIATSLGL